MEMLHLVAASVPPKVDEFLTQSRFWPGPLTILFPKKVNGLTHTHTNYDSASRDASIPDLYSCTQLTPSHIQPNRTLYRKQ
jgi:tRNA A37 threonylcarbamoyladenosine synthetase subunit TsaC/SUA5/YrdC